MPQKGQCDDQTSRHVAAVAEPAVCLRKGEPFPPLLARLHVFITAHEEEAGF